MNYYGFGNWSQLAMHIWEWFGSIKTGGIHVCCVLFIYRIFFNWASRWI